MATSPHTRRPRGLHATWALALATSLAGAGACTPRSSAIAMHEGIVAQRAGRLDRAAAQYRLALTKRPGLRGAENNLGVLALARGNLTGALAHFEAALGRGKEVPFARLNHAITRLRLGDPAGAAREARPLAALAGGAPPKTPEAAVLRATARVLLAAALVDEGAPQGGRASEATTQVRNALHALLAPPQGASPPLPKPLRAAALRVAGHLAVQAGAWAHALDSLEEAERLRVQAGVGDPPRDVALRAALALRTGQPERALALTAKPQDSPHARPGARAWRAVLRAYALAQTHEEGEAEALLDTLLAQTPCAAVAASAGAESAAPPRSDTADAPDLKGSAAKPCAAPSAPQVAALRLRAALRSAHGAWGPALADLDTVWRADPTAPGLLLDQATALAHLGRVEEARAAAAGALQRAPGDPRARALVSALR